MITNAAKDEMLKLGIRIHDLKDYFVEYRPDISVHEYFFLKDNRPFFYLGPTMHVAIITWYAMTRKAIAEGAPALPLVLGMYDVVVFSEIDAMKAKFLDDMLVNKLILKAEKTDNLSTYLLARTQPDPGFLLEVGEDALPFYIPMLVEQRYLGISETTQERCVVPVDGQCYTIYYGARTGETELNVIETYRL